MVGCSQGYVHEVKNQLITTDKLPSTTTGKEAAPACDNVAPWNPRHGPRRVRKFRTWGARLTGNVSSHGGRVDSKRYKSPPA